MSFTSMEVLHFLETKSDTLQMNLLILAFRWTTMNAAYFDNLVYLSEYSLTLMLS